MAYAFPDFKKETMARACLKDVPISFKQSIELARNLRGMMTDRAERYLDAVMRKRQPVVYTRFTNGAGHKRGVGAAKYPVKAAASFRELLKAAVANAENHGLGSPLKIIHLLAQEGSRPLHAGRKRGRLMKRTSIEIVLAETAASRKPAKPRAQKTAAKTSAAKTAPKATTSGAPQKPVAKQAKAAPSGARQAAPKAQAPAKDATPAGTAATKPEVKKDGN